MPSDSACMGRKFIGKEREGEREKERQSVLPPQRKGRKKAG